MNALSEVKLVADFQQGKPVYEVVPALEVGENRYRLASSPGFAAGVASGDEIQLDPSERLGYRMLRRAGNVCVQMFLRQCSQDDRQTLTEMVNSIGGWLDGGIDQSAGGLLIFTIPVTAGFDAIENTMAEASLKFAVDRWMYGNVYDVRDGVTPLNWWMS